MWRKGKGDVGYLIGHRKIRTHGSGLVTIGGDGFQGLGAPVMSSATTVRISWPEIIEEELDESSEVSERAGVGGRDSTVGRACVSRGMPDGEGRSGAVGDEVVAYLNWRWRVIPW